MCSCNSNCNCSNLQLPSIVGPVGPQGPAGPTGATGPAGPAGPQGNPGISTAMVIDVQTDSSIDLTGSWRVVDFNTIPSGYITKQNDKIKFEGLISWQDSREGKVPLSGDTLNFQIGLTDTLPVIGTSVGISGVPLAEFSYLVPEESQLTNFRYDLDIFVGTDEINTFTLGELFILGRIAQIKTYTPVDPSVVYTTSVFSEISTPDLTAPFYLYVQMLHGALISPPLAVQVTSKIMTSDFKKAI